MPKFLAIFLVISSTFFCFSCFILKKKIFSYQKIGMLLRAQLLSSYFPFLKDMSIKLFINLRLFILQSLLWQFSTLSLHTYSGILVRLGSAKTSIFFNFVPVFTILFSLLLGQPIYPNCLWCYYSLRCDCFFECYLVAY